VSDDKKDPEGKEKGMPVKFNEPVDPNSMEASIHVYNQPAIPGQLDPLHQRILNEPQKLVLFPSGDISWTGFKNIDEVIGFMYRTVGHNPQEFMDRLIGASKRLAESEKQRAIQQQQQQGGRNPKDPTGTPSAPPAGNPGFGGLIQ
jgi:hypothetical protein